ncbi:GntR family transcriptional regulator [Streptomyces sp. ST2-7A]|uniref:GntR family transcriptional regulator n=1 Tax=Streptomyces sp. ST2-7A TaxID=2907214 RepID=UPI001F41D939|nr:GntR family transcriptional regulator [Streptomyces sp. ST2-7A]MCE7080701.1 GntR family transcriptional regulator [Streptomyces sp. ST2-7A]
MPQAAPRGRYLEVAGKLRDRIQDDTTMVKLPPVSALMTEYGGVSRTLINRALAKLKAEGLVISVQGDGWHVVRAGQDSRPLDERMLDVFAHDALDVGSRFPSESNLCQRFGKSRTAVRSALAQLEGAGLLKQDPGKPRVVMALPTDRRKPQ